MKTPAPRMMMILCALGLMAGLAFSAACLILGAGCASVPAGYDANITPGDDGSELRGGEEDLPRPAAIINGRF